MLKDKGTVICRAAGPVGSVAAARDGTNVLLTDRIAQTSGMNRKQLQGSPESMTPKRLSTLAELANTPVFSSSDQASGMTSTVFNLIGERISD